MKTILITGSSRGIGLSLTKHYLEAGFKVVGISRNVGDCTHPNFHHYSMDLERSDEIPNTILKIKKDHGVPYALINNAGIASMNHSFLTPTKTVDRVFSVNFTATFVFCREIGKLMQRSGGGRIVNFSTVAVPLNLDGECIYASSKAAVEAMTRILAKEYGAFGITVNAVGPTPVRTDLIRGVPEGKLNELIERQAVKRFGTIDDVRNVVDFFLRDSSDFISGQVIYLGGVLK